MRNKLVLCLSAAILLPVIPVTAATLNVSSTDIFSNGLYDYTYTFSVTGGSVNNIYLGSADLSPLQLTFAFDNGPATAWSWLGNGSPQSYLQFFVLNSSLLNPGDTLRVTFASAFGPSNDGFAIALNSATGAATPQVSGVISPGAAPGGVPEPATLGLLLLAVMVLGIAKYHLRQRNSSSNGKDNRVPASATLSS